MELVKYFKEGYNASGRYTSANIVKDSPLINICF